MNTPVNSFIDMGPLGRYDALARLTALDRAYGIAEFDLDGRMVSVNMLFCRMFGYAPDALVGQSHLLLLPPDREAQNIPTVTAIKSG